jgi:hypothetical protein
VRLRAGDPTIPGSFAGSLETHRRPAAGPMMNLLTAVILYAVIFSLWQACNKVRSAGRLALPPLKPVWAK